MNNLYTKSTFQLATGIEVNLVSGLLLTGGPSTGKSHTIRLIEELAATLPHTVTERIELGGRGLRRLERQLDTRLSAREIYQQFSPSDDSPLILATAHEVPDSLSLADLRILKRLALEGRAAGIAIVVAAQGAAGSLRQIFGHHIHFEAKGVARVEGSTVKVPIGRELAAA